MTLSTPQRQQLRALIGHSLCYRGSQVQVIEFLEKEQALVLQLSAANRSLQDSQYGEPGRQVNATALLPIYDPDSPGELNRDVLALDIGNLLHHAGE